MKFRQKILVVLINFMLVFQPAIPLLEFTIFKDYIAEKLCINKNVPDSCCKGKCYLEKKMDEANQQSSGNKSSQRDKTEFSIYYLPISNLNDQNPVYKNVTNWPSTDFYKFSHTSKIFRPPIKV